MTENENKNFKRKEHLQGSEEEAKLKMVKAKLSDAASDNQRDTERMLEASEAARPAYELPDNDVDKKDSKPQSLQGSDEDVEENLGGSTNLSKDQLSKKENPATD